MVLNVTFNNISAIHVSWWSVLLVEKTTELSQITDKLYHIMLYTLPWSGFDRHWLNRYIVVINPTTIRSRLQRHLGKDLNEYESYSFWANQFGLSCLCSYRLLNYIWLSNLSTISTPDVGYSRHVVHTKFDMYFFFTINITFHLSLCMYYMCFSIAVWVYMSVL